MAIKYTDDMKDFVKNNIKGTSYKDMTELFNKKFQTDIKVTALKGFLGRYNFKNGRDTRLKKGNKPFNKGQKGIYYPGMEKTWFKKGNVPINHRPVGSERLSKDGYIEIKVKEPRTWRLKHNVIWESFHGLIPKNHVVIFLDQDKTNTDISNLKLITRRELLTMNRYNLFQDNAEMTNTSNILSKMIIAEQQAKKRRKNK